MAAQLLGALQPVADRVPVGEQLLGRGGDVAVVVQVGLDRLHQVGLVLVVVGDQRLRRSPRRSARARRGPRSSPAAAGGRRRCPRRRAGCAPSASPTLAARRASWPGPEEVHRVGGDAAARDRDREPGQALLQLADQRLGRAREPLVLGGGDDRDDLRPLPRVLALGRERAAADRAHGAQRRSSAPGERQSPLWAACGMRARDQHARRRRERSAPSSSARAAMSPRSVTSRSSRSGRSRSRPPRSPTRASGSAPAPGRAAS